jgi:excisionase family DNA binding protein
LQDKLMRAAEVAQTLGVTQQTVYAMVREKRLAAVHLGGTRTLRFRAADVEAVLKPVEHRELANV